VDPENRLDFGVAYLGSKSDIQHIHNSNVGNKDLIVEHLVHLNDNSPFTFGDVDLPLRIPAEDTYSLDVIFTPKTVGVVTDSLHIHSNSKDNPIYSLALRGKGEYVPPKPPGNVFSSMNGYDMVITWDEVTETIFDSPIEPDAYLVFYNGSENPDSEYYFHGDTTETEYVHRNVGKYARHMFYKVYAYKYYGATRASLASFGLKRDMSVSEVKEILRKADYGLLGAQELKTDTR
jgi:hypothetical protein